MMPATSHPLSLPLYAGALTLVVVSLVIFLVRNGPPVPPTPEEREVMLWANEVVIRTESGRPKQYVCQWDHPPVFAIVDGDRDFRPAIEQGMHLLNRVLIDTRLRGVSVTAGLGEAAADSASADVRIYWLADAEFRERLATKGYHDASRIDALTTLFWSEDMVIRSGTIFFNKDRLTDRQKLLHVALEEMIQSLGLLGDSWVYPDSIFYQGETPGIWPMALSPRDKALLRIFCNEMRPGMGRSALELVRPIAGIK